MSVANPWHYHREQLNAVLAAWEATNPTEHDRTRVEDCVMDVVQSPMVRGRPDSDHEDIWEARVDETNLVFMYIPNTESFEIWPWDISSPH